MPRTPEPAPTPWARAVADSIRAAIDAKKISGNDLGPKIGRSGNYVAMRFRHEAAFTLTDVEKIAEYLDMDPAVFLKAEPSAENVLPFRSANDSGFLDDAVHDQGLDAAAGTDETQAEDD